MSVQTILLDFSIDPARLCDESGQKAIFGQLETVLKDYVPNLILATDITIDGGSMKLLTGKKGTSVTVRMFDRGLVTVNIEYYKEEHEEAMINFKCTKLLENSVKLSLDCERIKLMPTIKRGYKFDVYLTSSESNKGEWAYWPMCPAGQRQTSLPHYLRPQERISRFILQNSYIVPQHQKGFLPGISLDTFLEHNTLLAESVKDARRYERQITACCIDLDERLLEYDIDGVIFDEQSPFQRVQIVHSKTLGNMLVLDDLQNISEADLIYTETLMAKGIESYEGKEIVILGGGDGALLYEILKENPKFIWMLEIDELVMKACNKHLNSICGDVLEKRKGPNYEIIVEDCMLTVNKFMKEGKKVDYIFGDLTDIPISESACGELWEFMITILKSAFKILKPTGKFMTHGNGATCPETLKMYEQELMKLKPPVKFTTSQAFVPSFMEEWVFYQISFETTDQSDA